jgi:hypothetical protein
MAVSVTHATAADGTFSAGGTTAWNEAHSVSGLGTMAEQNANNVAITGGSVTGITDLAVADGGTGSSTAAGAATNLGLGTGDSPQFTAVNVGHATDTTLARSSAGNLTVEGNLIYRAGGTDVPVADGGTGASDASTARTNLGLGTMAVHAQTPLRGFISGGVVTRSSATAIAVSACEYWDDTQGALKSYAGGTNSPTLAASKHYSVFLANGSLEVFQEDPPSTAYFGTARKRASGNGGRYIGSFFTNASSQIYEQDVKGTDSALGVTYRAFTAAPAAPFRCLSGGSDASFTAVSVASIVPRYISTELWSNITVSGTANAGTIIAWFSIDGTNLSLVAEMYLDASSGFGEFLLQTWVPVDPGTPRVYYKQSVYTTPNITGIALYFDVYGYRMTR